MQASVCAPVYTAIPASAQRSTAAPAGGGRRQCPPVPRVDPTRDVPRLGGAKGSGRARDARRDGESHPIMFVRARMSCLPSASLRARGRLPCAISFAWLPRCAPRYMRAGSCAPLRHYLRKTGFHFTALFCVSGSQSGDALGDFLGRLRAMLGSSWAVLERREAENAKTPQTFKNVYIVAFGQSATVPGLWVRGLLSILWDLVVRLSDASSGTEQVPLEACRRYASSGTEHVSLQACRQCASSGTEQVSLEACPQQVPLEACQKYTT